MQPSEILTLGLLALAIGLLVWTWHRLRRAQAQVRQTVAERAQARSQREEMERQLQLSRDDLVAVGAADLDALLLLDGDRLITWGNAAAWEMFGTRGPAIGQSFVSLVRDYELSQALNDAVSGRRPITRQAVVNMRTLRIVATPAAGSGGAAVAIQDVTELQRLGRARRDFVANISHELRTPLANIDLAAQTLRDGTGTDPALAKRMLDQIETQVDALSQLSQELMDLAQIESGQALLRLVPVEVESLVRNSLTNLLPQAAMKSQHISLMLPDRLQVLADEQQVARVIANLVHNAVKFTPEGGIISLYAVADGEDVRICVSDTGPGIPKPDQARIFERFYKQDRARTKGGTGLGLAIARHIVEGHGGRIWVESTPSEGATFCFTLPRA
jgi:two-component system phosphate regulon sensor histidine kinase PhoR